jgi:hypothetical protein
MDRVTSREQLWLIVAAPVAGTAVVWLTVLAVAGVTGTHPIWNLTPRNLAEAAALQDPAAVVRFIESGSDVNQPGEVRARVVLDEAATLTPIEAAAAARERELVQLLLDMGASPDASAWHRAYCISNADSVREVLQSHRPPGAVEHCPER